VLFHSVVKLSEQHHLEDIVDACLRIQGCQSHPELKLPAKIQLIKQDAMAKEEHAG
jgi:hypothetical protein